MESIKKYKFISLVTVYFLIVVVTSCGEGDDFGDLEEKSVFEPIKEISDNNSESPTDLPIITKISDSSITQFSTFQ